jgi:hypothetical protein
MRLRSRVGGKYAAGAPRTAILVVIASNFPLAGRFPVALADDFSYYYVEIPKWDATVAKQAAPQSDRSNCLNRFMYAAHRLCANRDVNSFRPGTVEVHFYTIAHYLECIELAHN